MALSAMQHLAVKYLAGGWTGTKVSEELKVPLHVLKQWKQLPEFQEALAKGIAHHAEMVEAVLLEGEAQAAETLIAALKAEGRFGPNWNARISAAITLLDRAGQRGRAVEKQLALNANVHSSARVGDGNVEDALRKALRDPGVRAWLKQSGALESLIVGAEDVEAEVISSEAPDVSAPLMLSPPDVEVA